MKAILFAITMLMCGCFAEETVLTVKPVEPVQPSKKDDSTVKTVEVKVWCNKTSHVYHYEGTRYFGKTSNGEYKSEVDAIKEGYRASKLKPKKVVKTVEEKDEE